MLLKRIEIQAVNVQETIVACAILHNLRETDREPVPPTCITEVEDVNLMRPRSSPVANRAAIRSSINIRRSIAEMFKDVFLIIEN